VGPTFGIIRNPVQSDGTLRSDAMAFLRKHVVMERSGFHSSSSFHDAINDGRFPPPDAYLGPKTPVWRDTTYGDWEDRTVEKARPPENVSEQQVGQERGGDRRKSNVARSAPEGWRNDIRHSKASSGSR